LATNFAGLAFGVNDRNWPLADLQIFDDVGYRMSAFGETGRAGLILAKTVLHILDTDAYLYAELHNGWGL
jgi:hypothetical protein